MLRVKHLIILVMLGSTWGCGQDGPGQDVPVHELVPDGGLGEDGGQARDLGTSTDQGIAPERPSFCDNFDPGADPGFLGIRRLNRTGYDNTLSALIGTEIRVAHRLPVDEIAKSFDNISAAQSMSPLHFEGHHEAIQDVVEGPLAAPAPAIRVRYEAENMNALTVTGNPTGNVQGDLLRLRQMAIVRSPDTFEFRPGQYRVRFRAYGGRENLLHPPKVRIRFGSQPASDTIAVEATVENPETYELLVDVGAEVGPVELQFLNGKSSSAPFPSHYTTSMACTVDNTMADDCQRRFGNESFCFSESCRFLTPCQSDGQCQNAGQGDICGPHPACRNADVNRCCLTTGAQRRWLWVDWFEIEEINPPAGNPVRDAVLTCDSEESGTAACARQIFAEFGLRAWRRPLTEDELERLLGFLTLAQEEGDGFGAAIDLGINAILLSPNYLFRVEVDPEPNEDIVHPVAEYELATRLSYFLWNTGPDDVLLQLAGEGVLNTDEVLGQQLIRMLEDPRAEQLHLNFGGQWLHTRALDDVQPSTMLFPEFDEESRHAIKGEAELFFATFQDEDRDVRQLLTADETFINDRLAEHYGLPVVGSDIHQRVSTAASGRRGIFGQAGFLTLTSELDHTSVVKRGKWVLAQLLCSEPEPPPPDVEGFSSAVDPSAPLKERMAQHRTDPSCAGCHQDMDNIGFAFEHFDPIGRYRERDAFGNAIDATGEMPEGPSFDGPQELAEVLVDDPRFVHCVAEQMLTFAIGRDFGADFCGVKGLADRWNDDEYRFKSLIKRIVMSPYFRARRGKSCEN